MESRKPAFSIICLSKLCTAVLEDGLVTCVAAAGQNGGEEADGGLSNHTSLSRDPRFRSFVLRSCCNLLEGCRASLAVDAVLAGESTHSHAPGESLHQATQILGQLLHGVALLKT